MSKHDFSDFETNPVGTLERLQKLQADLLAALIRLETLTRQAEQKEAK